MKLKYYLRGLGVGVICTAIIMGIALSGNKKETLTDAEIIERARLLGMVMEEENSDLEDTEDISQELEENLDAEETEPKESEDEQKTEDDQKAEDEQKAEDDQESEEEETEKSEDEKGQEQKSEDEKGQEQKSEDEKDPEAEKTEENQTSKDTSTEMVEIEILKGDYSDVISQKLFQAGLIPDAETFNKYLMQKGVDSTLRVGVHQIPKGATPDEIIEILQEKPQ